MHRINQSSSDSARLVDESINLSLSNEPSINQSLIERLIAPLFVEVCSFLSLDEKCASLTALNKSINQSVKQTINQSMRSPIVIDYSSSWSRNECLYELHESMMTRRCTGLLRYIAYASHIAIRLPRYKIDRSLYQSIKENAKSALNSGSLVGLSIYAEMCDWITLFPANQSDPTDRSFSLHMLSLDLSDDTPDTDEVKIDRGEWSSNLCDGLKRCSKLKKLYVKFPRGILRCFVSFSDFVSSLPDSLEELTLEGIDGCYHVLNSKLRSPSLLPNLQMLSLPGASHQHFAEIGHALTSTLISDTGIVRPIIQWKLSSDSELLCDIRHFALVQLHLSVLTDSTVSLLSDCPSDLFPNLTRLSIQAAGSAGDLSLYVEALMKFASKRQLTGFELNCFSSTSDHVLSDTSVRLLSSISSLRYLSINASECPLASADDLMNLIPANSWPALESLDLWVLDLCELQLRPILLASPSLRYAEVSTEPSEQDETTFDASLDNPSLIVAMLLAMCPMIEYVKSDGEIQMVDSTVVFSSHLADWTSAFEQYPINEFSVKHLMYVSISGPCREALDFVCQQLSVAPKLYGVDFDLSNWFECKFDPATLMCLRHLPHLRSFHGMSDVLVELLGYSTSEIDNQHPFGELVLSRWARSLNVQNMCTHIERARYLSLRAYDQYAAFLCEGHIPLDFYPATFRSHRADFFDALNKLSATMETRCAHCRRAGHPCDKSSTNRDHFSTL